MESTLTIGFVVLAFLSTACSDFGSPPSTNNLTAGIGGTAITSAGSEPIADPNPSESSGINPSHPVTTNEPSGWDSGSVENLDATRGLYDSSSVDSGKYDRSLNGREGTFGGTSENDNSMEGISGDIDGNHDSALIGAPSNDASGTNLVCPHTGNIRYTMNRSASPTADQLDAYQRLTSVMDEAVWYYNCYTDLDKQLWVNYSPGVPTAEANIDGWMSFGSDRNYMQLPTAMHEIAHTLGIGYYTFARMTDSDGIWTGRQANAVLASIPDPRDTQLHADSMHFWPYGLNYASEYENENDLIYHCRIVTAIRQDMGL